MQELSVGDSVCARVNRVLSVIVDVCNVVGNQLIMCFTTNFCGITTNFCGDLSLTFVAFYR